MALLHILSDSRERKPYEFESFNVTTETVTLATGDYTLPGLCEHDEENDTYHPRLAVERKTAQDFLSSITQDRERFKSEIKRAGGWEQPLVVMVEESWESFMNRYSDALQYREIYPNQIEGTVNSWEKHYNVEFKFWTNRPVSERETFDTLVDWQREAK